MDDQIMKDAAEALAFAQKVARGAEGVEAVSDARKRAEAWLRAYDGHVRADPAGSCDTPEVRLLRALLAETAPTVGQLIEGEPHADCRECGGLGAGAEPQGALAEAEAREEQLHGTNERLALDCVDAEDDRADLAAMYEAAAAERDNLTALLRECNAVCLCGCPESEHEADGCGESCANDEHQCIRVPRAVLGYVAGLRLMVRAMSKPAPAPSEAVNAIREFGSWLEERREMVNPAWVARVLSGILSQPPVHPPPPPAGDAVREAVREMEAALASRESPAMRADFLRDAGMSLLRAPGRL